MFCRFFSVFDSLAKSWKLGQALTPLGRHPCLSLPGPENPSFVYPQRTHHVTGPTHVGFAACDSECVDLKCKGDACCIHHSVHSLQHRAWHTVSARVQSVFIEGMWSEDPQQRNPQQLWMNMECLEDSLCQGQNFTSVKTPWPFPVLYCKNINDQRLSWQLN